MRGTTLFLILNKINLEHKMKINDIFKGKEIETSSHKDSRTPTMLYINLDEKCNENCVFCVVKGENQGKFGSMSKKEAKRIIKDFINTGGKNIVFTGGEPTLRNDLPEIIEYAEQFKTLHSISIITNGARISDEKCLNSLINADKKNIINFCISLHSHKEKISELLTRTKGTFKKTIAGIENVIKKGKRLSIYQVITSTNYQDLLGFVKFLHKNYPQIKDVTFAYPFPQGNALLNDWIYMKLSSLRPHLLKALKFLEKEKYQVNIASCGQFPLCALPGFEEKVLDSLIWSEENISGVVGEKSFHEFEMMSKEWIDQYKNKNKKCNQCLLNQYCQGFWKKYIDLFGFDGIQPINQDNFKGNKIKLSLTNEKHVQKIIDKIKKDKLNLIILKSFSAGYLKKLTGFLNKNRILTVIIYQNNALYPK